MPTFKGGVISQYAAVVEDDWVGQVVYWENSRFGGIIRPDGVFGGCGDKDYGNGMVPWVPIRLGVGVELADKRNGKACLF